MPVIAARGAINVEKNSAEEIQKAVALLLDSLIKSNQLKATDLVAAWFTMTPDLNALNPALAARRFAPEWNNVPMLCSQELPIPGMLPLCIRVLIQWNTIEGQIAKHAYLKQAQSLRPDLI